MLIPNDKLLYIHIIYASSSSSSSSSLSAFYLIRVMNRNERKTDFQCSLFRWFLYRSVVIYFVPLFLSLSVCPLIHATPSRNFPLLWRELNGSFFLHFFLPFVLSFFALASSLVIFTFSPICRSFLNLFSLNFFTIIYYCKGCKIKSAKHEQSAQKRVPTEWTERMVVGERRVGVQTTGRNNDFRHTTYDDEGWWAMMERKPPRNDDQSKKQRADNKRNRTREQNLQASSIFSVGSVSLCRQRQKSRIWSKT